MGEKEFMELFFKEEFILGEVLKYSRKTLLNLHYEGKKDKYPPFVKLGKSYLFPKKDFFLWARDNGVSVPIRLN